MTTPRFSWHHLNQWQWGVLPNVLLVGALVAYWAAAQHAPGWARSRRIFFTSGAVVTLLATQSVVGVFDMSYFADHMVQHLLLIMVAAPLFALSAPLYLVFIPLTHLTGLFNLMLEHMWVHHLEQVGFLVVGYLFFRTAFGLERGRVLHPGLRLVFVMAAVPVDTISGLALAMSSHNPFAPYRHLAPSGATATSILSDIHLGGAIMWIGGDALMLLACIPIAISWVRWETLRTAELDAELDAQGL